MQSKEQSYEKIRWTSVPLRKLEPSKSASGLHLGIDVGSTSSDIVVLDSNQRIIYSNYKRTMGRAASTVLSQLEELFKIIEPDRIESAAAAGSGSRLIASLLEIPYINEVSAQAAAIVHLYRDFSHATVIEMGGQDSKLLFLKSDNGRLAIADFALNSACAAGTGSFLDQQAQRLGVSIEDQFGKMALSAKNTPTLAGRCSVFAKSDMIHLQQQATPTEEIIAGLCLALARNLKGNLGRGREVIKPLIFTGGVAANAGVVQAIEKVFGLQKGQLIVPKEHFFTGAIGAVLKSQEAETNSKLKIEGLYNYLNSQAGVLEKALRREALSRPVNVPSGGEICFKPQEKKEAYIGVDVGSISTNVVVIDGEKNILAKVYIMTAGRPLDAVKKGLQLAAERLCGGVEILGAAATGSGRYLTGDFLGADIVINEITAQAAGAAVVCPQVDTIFEIGGQDSKYIAIENGVVVDFEMNHACAAGTGSFLEEQAERLGISIKDEFAALAFQSARPIKLGERCTVFIESDLLDFQQQGAETKDLVAGLAYSIAANYLNRVVGRRKIGDNICFQGGTAFNRAVHSAFEKILGKKIIVPAHHEVTGALGAAVIALENAKQKSGGVGGVSGFRGFENLINIDYQVESFDCDYCSNNCQIKKVALPEREPLYYGCRCDRYNISKTKKRKKIASAFEYRSHKLRQFSKIDEPVSLIHKEKIGIPFALLSHQYLPLFSIFFRRLGFDVRLSAETGKSTIKKGVESIAAEPCFPVKVAFGHIAELIEQEVDYIFLPSIVSLNNSFASNKVSKLCPYVQSLAYQAKAAFADKLGRTKFLSPVIRLGDGRKEMLKSFVKLAARLKVRASLAERAADIAISEQKNFQNALLEKGRQIISSAPKDGRLFVLVSRSYNGCDAMLNLHLADKLAEMGFDCLPTDMLSLADAPIGVKRDLHDKMYWDSGQKILRAAEVVRGDRRLFAIYLSNFNCGPDSFLMTFFREIMGEKPCLCLELDEHSADTGLITRLEAFIDSLNHFKPKETARPEKIRKPQSIAERKIFIPFMSDCSCGMAAAMKAHGRDAEVMKCSDEEGLIIGRKFTTGKECLPCAITTGDMLTAARRKDFEPEKSAFFMPSTSGPCRLGLYNCLQRFVLGYAGLDEAMIVSPNQDTSFYEEFASSTDKSRWGFMLDAWIAMVGIDLMGKLRLKIRPYAKDKQAVQQTYDKCLKIWLNAAENSTPFGQRKKLFADFAKKFSSLEFDYANRRPLIGVVGEIYIRNHPFANNDIIKKLEALGAACSLASLAEWVYYTNFIRLAESKRKGRIKDRIVNLFTDFIEHKIEKALALPLEKRFGQLAEKDVKEILNYSSPYIHDSLEGEAILSVGRIVEYFHEGACGVVNVMPFGCMPSTIVGSITPRLSRDCKDMPILNISFDGSEDAAFQTRLEAFYEQCRRNLAPAAGGGVRPPRAAAAK